MPTDKFKLKAEREELLKQLKGIAAAADAESRDLTEEEEKQRTEIKGKIVAIDNRIARLKENEALEQGQKELVDWMGGDGSKMTGGEVPKVSVKPRFEDDPARGFKTPREFITAVMDISYGARMDERLKSLHVSREKIIAAAGSDEHRSDVGPYGGFGLPDSFMPGFMMLEPEPSPIKTRFVPMRTPSLKIRARVDKTHTSSVSGGLTVSRRAQTAQATATRAEQELIDLIAHSLIGYAYETEEMLQDSPETFAALIASGFRQEFESRAIDERINGDGAGEYLGIMKSSALISVAKESGQSASTIFYENCYKMRARCWHYAESSWIANHDCLPQLIKMVHVVGTGGVPVWQPSAREGEPDLLLGRPIIFTEYCQTLGTTGDIILGVWSEFLEGVYQPLRGEQSIHVRFDRNERAFRFTMRTAGAPWWRAALTPKYSSDTLSPYVALATRS